MASSTRPDSGTAANSPPAPSGPPDPPAAEQLPALIEALLFVADGPVEPAALRRALGVRRAAVEGALRELGAQLEGRGLRLQQGPDGVQLITAPLAAGYVEQFLGVEGGRKLSTAALETLAIVAYRQPVTRGQIDGIRGVSSDGALATLRARELVAVCGRADGPGRPALFATTQRFLEHFGLERAEDLPPLPADVPAPDGQQLMMTPPASAEEPADGDPPQPSAESEAESGAPLSTGMAARFDDAVRAMLRQSDALHGPPASSTGPAAADPSLPATPTRLPAVAGGESIPGDSPRLPLP